MLMLILALSLLDTQRLYRVSKSAVVDAVEAAFAAGAVSSTGLAAVLFRTISAQAALATWSAAIGPATAIWLAATGPAVVARQA